MQPEKIDVPLSKSAAEVLWALLNTQGVAVPPNKAQAMAELYGQAQSLAVMHGIDTAKK